MTTESRIQIDKLDSTNWHLWRRRFNALLLSRELAGVIDGSDEDKAHSNQVMGLIQLYLSDAYLSMADGVATAKGLWDKLESTFTAQNNAKKLQLRQELNGLKKKPTESVPEYVARAKELATNLEAVGHKPEASEVTLSVLAGLPKEYSVLVTIVGTLRQTQTLEELLPSLLQMEQQIKSDEQEAVPIYGARDGMRRKQPRHNQQRNGRSDRPKFQGRCNYCGKTGHKEVECRSRIKDQQGIRTVAYGASAMGAYSDDWVIDSGASKHLTPDRQHLCNYRSVAPNTAVTFINGYQAAAVGQGEVILHVKTASGSSQVTLQEVLHVPEATVNLFSTRQAMNSGGQVTFSDNRCSVSTNGTVYMEGISQRDGLMVIKQERQRPTFALAATAASKESPELWHRRFGHLGYDNLFKLKNKHMVEGISVPAQDFKEQLQQKPFCEACTLAKQHRLPFPDSDSKSSSILELVHMDVCGPLTSHIRWRCEVPGNLCR